MHKKLLFFFYLIFSISTLSAQLDLGHRSFSFTDENRSNRDVTIEIYYPADIAGENVDVANGSFPIIIFGHGFVTAWSEYSIWWTRLVPEGYILVLPTTEGSFAPSHEDFGKDLAFLANNFIAENENEASPFFQKINGNAAVMGHSMGGGASFLAAENNTQIKTMIALAPAETGPSAIATAANIDIPSMVLAGSKDCITPPADQQLPLYNALNANYKVYAEITDASHCQFGDASTGSNCRTGELLSCPFTSTLSKEDQHTRMLLLAKPWLDFYLKNDCEAFTIFYNHLTTATTHTFQESGTSPKTVSNTLDINQESLLEISFPNPVKKDLQVKIKAEVEMPIDISIVDCSGKRLLAKKIEVQNGDNDLSFALTGFSNGLYFLQIRGQDFLIVEKFVKN